MPSVADRVRETTTTVGTGAVSLEGAATGFRTFSAAFAPSTSVYYCIEDGTNWEVGVGTVTSGSPWTLTRGTVLASSNAGALVPFSVGTKNVFCTNPAAAIDAHAATSKATPVDADEIGLLDSAIGFTLKKLTWANVKATLKTYLDTLYLAIVAPGLDGKVLRSNGTSWASDYPLMTDIYYPAAQMIGAPVHIDTLQELFNHMESAGVVDGCAATDNGNGTISIASGTALLHVSADPHTSMIAAALTAQGPLTLTDNSLNWVYIDYNAGVPTWQVSTSQASFNCLDKCIGYTVFREGNRLNIIDAREQNVDGNRKTRQLFLKFSRFIHAAGGTTLGGTGLALTVTAGEFFFMLQSLPHDAFDTSIAGTANANTFDLWYRDGLGGWTRTADQKTIVSTVYDNNTGTPVSLGGASKVGVSWVYIVHDGPSTLQVVMGQVAYNNTSAASTATPPASLPPEIAAHGSLIGYVDYVNGATSFTSIYSAFTQTFAASAATEHNGLSGLQGGTTFEYYHLTNAEHAELTSGIGLTTHAATDKATPVDADEIPLADSAASFGLKKLTWANLKATLLSTWKDATGGLVGLTLFKINFKNAANTFTSFLTNANTAARTYTFPDYDATMATQAGTEVLTNKTLTGALATATLSDNVDTLALTDAQWVNRKVEQYFSRENDIGTPGHLGFGVGICPALPAGFVKLPGTDFPSSDQYGNYQYSDGSIMVWVPAFYYKIGTGSNGLAVNVVDVKSEYEYATVSAANTDGYALHRAFYDGGAVQRGVFVDKYQCSNNAGTASSIALGNPLSSNSAHNPFSGLTGAPPNFYYGAFAAAKTRGASFFPASRFIQAMLALLAMAHSQASTATTYCAWYSATYNYPKGNNNNALHDADDATVTYTSDGYSNCGKTGSGAPLAKTTHNGQSSGIADLNGNMWEIGPGFTSIATAKTITGVTQANPCVVTAVAHGIGVGATKTVMVTSIVGMTELNTKLFTATGIDADHVSLNVDSTALTAYASGGTLTIGTWYALNTAAAMKNVTGGNTLATDHWGATGIAALFTEIAPAFDLTYPNNGVAQRYGSGASQVLSEATSGDAWKLAGLGMPKDANSIDATGTNLFGKDYYYQSVLNELCPISGGDWGSSSTAGAWGLYLYRVRGDSSSTVGFRAALYL